MKKLTIILAVPVMLALTMVFVINTPAQDTSPQIYLDNAYQNWPPISGIVVAYHNLPKEHHPWENLDIYEIADFIDDSIKEGTLLEYESDPAFGADPYRGERLTIMKDKIDAAANALKNSTFQETCQLLLDAYSGTDGLNETPDLIYGPAAPELAKMIEYMRIEIIGCN
jgi:hypothetical protein